MKKKRGTTTLYDPYAEFNALDPYAPPIGEPYEIALQGPDATAPPVHQRVDEALRAAVRDGRHEIAIDLFARGADPYWRPYKEAQTAFEMAAGRDSDPEFAALRDLFATHGPELAQAVIAQDADAVERLLADGASPNTMTGEDSHIPGVPGPQYLLITATVLGNARIVKLLVDHGARLDRRVGYSEYRGTMYVGNAELEQEEWVAGKNALEYATEAGRQDLVKLLSG